MEITHPNQPPLITYAVKRIKSGWLLEQRLWGLRHEFFQEMWNQMMHKMIEQSSDPSNGKIWIL